MALLTALTARWRAATSRRFLLAATAGAVLALGAAQPATAAAGFPARPITLVVPFPAGGTPDILARILGEDLGRRLGQPLIVENRAGAGGNIGAQAVARAAPDGYTLLMCAFGCTVAPSLYQPAPYDIVKDFAPVAMIGTVPSVLVVNPQVPANTLPELLAYARANPGKLNSASSGVGGSAHLATELLKQRAGIDVAHIPYKGAGQVAADLLGGQVDMYFDNLPASLANIRAGKLRALAVASSKRAPAIPDVPTFAEGGVPDFLITPWFGIMAPARTPAAELDALHHAFAAALQAPEVAAKMRELGVETASGTRQSLGDFVGAETARWKDVIQANHIKAE
ncbi:tripartite tricarboxylate transporter substrate binding protein [Achromobacter animicus]|uniref:tripartite tricarboxylate transporter substrate binding protein n=1 Tax=Achromobacter animicus TaxID=1389935 RepID=UPI002449BEBF|nr:tripartite tricarboxylate transporter substrate binding protein [Achromobacter animicus]MDH0681160.1 tripartite tricarboxylate transporter substrate binding protein [Achromobacter animicus]